jgi:O-antigen ligase
MRQIAFWLSLLLIFAIPWENSAHIEGLGSLAKLIGVAAAGMWIATVARSGEFRRLSLFQTTAILFILWNGVSVLWSVDIDSTLERAITYAQTLALVIILWDLYRTPESLRSGMQAYVFGAFMCVALLAHVYFYGGGADARRLTAEGANPNVLAFGLVLALPMAWYLARLDSASRAGLWLRLANLAYLPAACLAIVLTGSRAAMGSALVALGFMVFSLSQLRPLGRVLLLAVVIGSPALALPYFSPETIERISSMTYEVGDGSYGGRNVVWREAAELLASRPWLGIGSGAFITAAVETRKAPHNFVISLLVELGIIGFSLFVAVIVVTGVMALRQDRWMCRMWLALLLMWVLNAAVHNYEDKKHTWVLFSFVAIGAGLTQRDRNAAALPASEAEAVTDEATDAPA